FARVFVFGEYAAQQGACAKDGPEVGGDSAAGQFFGLPAPREGHLPGFGGGDIGEDGVAAPPFDPLGGRGIVLRETDVTHLVPDHDEASGVEIGQWTNEDGGDGGAPRRVDT